MDHWSWNTIGRVNRETECILSHVQLFATHAGGPSVRGVSQARTLGWVAISPSRAYSRLRAQTRVSSISCTGRRMLYPWATGRVSMKPTASSVWHGSFSLSHPSILSSHLYHHRLAKRLSPPPFLQLVDLEEHLFLCFRLTLHRLWACSRIFESSRRGTQSRATWSCVRFWPQTSPRPWQSRSTPWSSPSPALQGHSVPSLLLPSPTHCQGLNASFIHWENRSRRKRASSSAYKWIACLMLQDHILCIPWGPQPAPLWDGLRCWGTGFHLELSTWGLCSTAVWPSLNIIFSLQCLSHITLQMLWNLPHSRQPPPSSVAPSTYPIALSSFCHITNLLESVTCNYQSVTSSASLMFTQLCPTLCDPGLLCPSPSPRVCSNWCPLCQRCHPTIASSVTWCEKLTHWKRLRCWERLPSALHISWSKYCLIQNIQNGNLSLPHFLPNRILLQGFPSQQCQPPPAVQVPGIGVIFEPFLSLLLHRQTHWHTSMQFV